MAEYDHLPIYKRTMDLAVFVERMIVNFSRSHRYTLCSELRSMCHEALGLIADANSAVSFRVDGERPSFGGAAGREATLYKLRSLLERLKIHLVIAREVNAFPNKGSFVQSTEMVVYLCRQNEGWIKSTVKARYARRPAFESKGRPEAPRIPLQGEKPRGPGSTPLSWFSWLRCSAS